MAIAHIHQIYYCELTRSSLDPGFIPLDNSANERPDWREYWPIRKFLRNESLIQSDYYGFFSPRFKEKTNLSATQVLDFIASTDASTDVIMFSPYPDYSAPFFNVFDQGEMIHTGIQNLTQLFLNKAGFQFQIAKMINDSRNTVFCNYFVAKPSFWRTWSELADKLFAIAEDSNDELGRKINVPSNYVRGQEPMKVFIIERLASLLLGSQPRWRSKAFNSYLLPAAYPPLMAKHSLEVLTLDALKIAFLTQGYPAYMQLFKYVRSDLFSKIKELKRIEAEYALKA